MQLEVTKNELETAKRPPQRDHQRPGHPDKLVDKLSHDLTENEVNLAKALGVIRRLEEDLNRLCRSRLRPGPTPSPPTRGAGGRTGARARAAAHADPAARPTPSMSRPSPAHVERAGRAAPGPQRAARLFKRFTDKTDS